MSRSYTPHKLWDFCCQYAVDLRNRLARPLPQLHGRTPYEILTGNTPDISEFLEFSWYQPIWYYEPSAFPNQERLLARWIGIAHRVGQAMCYWILPHTGIPIARTTIQAITPEELQTLEIQQQLEKYDESIAIKLDALQDELQHIKIYREDEPDDIIDDDMPMEPEAQTRDVDTIEADAYDEFLLTEPLLIRDGQLTRATIISRKRDHNDNPIGTYHHNPLLNTRVYLAQFPDGHIAELSANVIAEAIYDQVDDDGIESPLFQDIIGHEKDKTALTEQEANEIVREEQKGKSMRGNNNIHPLYTTKGWRICIAWTDGSTSWHSLAEIKNSYPVALAEYAIANSLEDEPAFAWWVKKTIKHQKHLINAIKTRYAKRTHKFGIRVPSTVEEALTIDKATKTTFWHDAIQKEMRNNRIAFKFPEDGERIPIGYKWIRCHMIFDVKMDFTRKARFVAGGHMTDPPSTITSKVNLRTQFVVSVSLFL